MEIAFCRIDDRLIHAQILTIWSKVTGCNCIVCCNDELANDEFRKKLLLQNVPPNLKAYITSIDTICEAYRNPKFDAFKVLFIFTNPADVVRAVEGGIPFKSVNLGVKAFSDGDTELSPNFAVNAEDIDAIKTLIGLGLEVEMRKSPNDIKIDVATLLKDRNI